jgi:uncharacterized membrane-anchored protein YjiN (DUF445 family)
MKQEISTRNPIVQQLTYEVQTWVRLIGFIRDETTYFKMRLAEVVSANVDDKVVEQAEKFQEEFLAQDRIIIYLSDELKKQNKLLEKDMNADENILQEVIKNQNKLRREIKKAEGLFKELKDKFISFLHELF